MTGDAADLTVDPIVNLRDAHLIEMYLHRASADRDGQLHHRPGAPVPGPTTTQVDIRRIPDSRP